MEAVRRLFSPEFRNRLDATIQFAPLDAATIERVVDKLLIEVEAQLEPKGVGVTIDEARGTGLLRRATTRRWARVRWRALSRSSSSAAGRRTAVRQAGGRRQVRVSVAADQSALVLECTPATQPK